MNTEKNNQTNTYTALDIKKAYYIAEIHLTGTSFMPNQIISTPDEYKFAKDEALDWIRYQSVNFEKNAASDPDRYGFKVCLIEVMQKSTSAN